MPLDNPGDDRDLGATDVYDGATLNACDKFTPHGGLQVKVNLAGDNAWELDSVKVKFDDDSEFNCPFNDWLDNGDGAKGPGSRTASCTKTSGAGMFWYKFFATWILLSI